MRIGKRHVVMLSQAEVDLIHFVLDNYWPDEPDGPVPSDTIISIYDKIGKE